MKHSIDVRIYYEDTDAGGIVYHSKYLNFAERGRTEFLRKTGFQCSDVHNDLGLLFVVRKIEIDYLKTAALDDLLQMETAIAEINNSSFIMHQCAVRDGEVIADMYVVIVCVSKENYKPLRLPKNIKEAFQNYLETVR